MLKTRPGLFNFLSQTLILFALLLKNDARCDVGKLRFMYNNYNTLLLLFYGRISKLY